MIRSTINFSQITFPNGETRIDLGYVGDVKEYHDFEWIFKGNADVMELLLFVDALKRAELKVGNIFIEYFPYSRQDRNDPQNSSFSLKVMADIINSIGAKHIIIADPHSEVTPALINNVRVMTQYEMLGKFINRNEGHYLISPDAGASKKTVKFICSKTYALIQCNKERDPNTGVLSNFRLSQTDLVKNTTCYIIDDICEKGGTFIAIAKELKKHNPGKIVLLVTHGFFSGGLEVFDGLIDEIYTKDGRVK